jgi:hypothetical protein
MPLFSKDMQQGLQAKILTLIDGLRPATRGLSKESLLKALDINLFIKCDTLFRNKLKGAINALGTATTNLQP